MRYVERLNPADRADTIRKVAAKKLAGRLEHQLQLAGLDEMDESAIEDLPDSGEEQ